MRRGLQYALIAACAAPFLIGAYFTGEAFLNIQQSWTAGQGTTCFALTDASTIAVDASKSNCFTVTLGGNRTLGFPSSAAPVSGQDLNFIITQDGTGSRTLAYGSGYNFPGGTPVLQTAAGSVDVIACVATSTTVARCGRVGNGNAVLPNPSTTTLGGIQSFAAVTNQWINAISTSGVPSAAQPAFTNLSGALAQTQVPTGGTNLQFQQTNGSGTGAWASVPTQICGSSGVTLNGAGVTDFIGIGSLSITQAATWFPSSLTGTATQLYVTSSVAPGSAKTFVYTMMGGTTGGTAEAITCTISGTSATTCNDTAHTFAITAADLLSLRVVTTAASATATHGWCLKVTVP